MIVLGTWTSYGQIRNKGANYLELWVGKPLLFSDNGLSWRSGESVLGLSYAIGSARGNYHRITTKYRCKLPKIVRIKSLKSVIFFNFR
jgi:hypothetical protein